MGELILTTYDWVPEPPRGFVRDFRIRWALEEAGLPYSMATTPFHERGPEHLAHQPFAQVPWLTDGGITIFESGAMLLHVGELSDGLLPADPAPRAAVLSWLFAALNSVEMMSLPWSLLAFTDDRSSPERARWDGLLKLRLDRMEPVLAKREWLAGAFSIADIMMADVLRLPDRFDALAEYPACRAYVARAKGRPAFAKAHADQLAHFAAAD
jgi:glutathione S-transferase